MIKSKLKVNIYLDGASLSAIKKYQSSKYIKGFTTNPSLMREENIKDYIGILKKLNQLSYH